MLPSKKLRRFPTLNHWIQMQTNLHRVSEFAVMAEHGTDDVKDNSETKTVMKRFCENDSDSEIAVGNNISSPLPEVKDQSNVASDAWHESPKSETSGHGNTVFLSFDWESEGPYEKAVERLIDEGKLLDALALSNRFLRDGASDWLLEMLIISGEDDTFSEQTQGSSALRVWSNSWQYCLRLKDKELAARLALKYLHRWELEAALDVLAMCSCHLPDGDLKLRHLNWLLSVSVGSRTSINTRVFHCGGCNIKLALVFLIFNKYVVQRRQALCRYKHILCADDRYNSWQEVETDCKQDPEGLELRLAEKGAVSAALQVAESAGLSIELRRELKGRRLVKLLNVDPVKGGCPAEASRFLSSLCD